jgi:uncharacterized protein (TIGR02996 family)
VNERAIGRVRILEEDFIPHAAEIFAKHPEIRSQMLCVAQYWADEADDAVHANIVYSKRDTPRWPHVCGDRSFSDDEEEEEAQREPPVPIDERCSYCGDFGWVPWDDNNAAIPAFEAFCREDSSQEGEVAETYLPYAIAHRDGEGVRIEVVGRITRPHLEMPEPTASDWGSDARVRALLEAVYAAPSDLAARDVLADALLERGDARGEFIVCSRHGKPTSPIVGRTVLGRLGAVVPEDEVVYRGGFPSAVSVYISEDTLPLVSGAAEWATIETLRFLVDSAEYLGPEMRALRDVGTLSEDGLRALIKHGAALPLARLAVLLNDKGSVDLLRRAPIERLEYLAVDGAAAKPEALDAFLGAKSIGTLEVRSLDPEVVAAWAAAPRRARALSFAEEGPSAEATGFRLSVGEDRARVETIGLAGEVTFPGLVPLLGVLPKTVRVIDVVQNALFAPTEAEIERLGHDTGREVRVTEPG